MGFEHSARRVAEALRKCLAQAGLSLREIDRRLGWSEDHLSRLLRGRQGDLKIENLLAVLQAAGIEERSFFAQIYDLEPRRPGGEIPYSIGHLSDLDAPEFPPAQEVVTFVRQLVGEGLRRPSTAAKGRPTRPLSDETDLPKGPSRSK